MRTDRPGTQFVYPPIGLADQVRYQQYFNQTRPAPINDGFAITDNHGGRVVAVDGQSRTDYDKMIQQKFKYTQDNYADAYKEAARTGKPLVAIFGGFEHNNSRELIQNGLPAAERGAAKDAIYIYVDRSKCKDGELAKFADGQLAGGHNAAVSIVFTVKPGKDGSPQPEPATFRWQGAHSSMIGSFNQAIEQAHEKMQSYKPEFEKLTPGKDAEEQTGNKFEAAYKKINGSLNKASDAKDWHTSEGFYHEAIDAADKIKPQEIQAERIRLAKELAKTEKNSSEHSQLTQELAHLRTLEQAKWTTRADLGIACMNWANNQTGDLQHQFREIGSEWIKAAAELNPKLFSDKAILRRVTAAGIPDDELDSLFVHGRERPRDPKPTVDVPTDNAPKDQTPKDQTNQDTNRDTNKETKKLDQQQIIKEDEDKAVKSEQEYNEALQRAAEQGLPVIVKIGSTSCGPCKKMAPYLKQAESDLKDKAVVVRVLYENTPELAQQLGADQGVPITMVARAVSKGGAVTLVPLKTKNGFAGKPDELDTFIKEGLQSFKQPN